MNDNDPYKVAYERERKARQLAEKLLTDKTRELYDNVLNLEGAVGELQVTQSHLIQSEKMSSLGELTAGVAHEINNPIGYSYSNLTCLADYLRDFFTLDKLIQTSVNENKSTEDTVKEYQALRKKISAEFIIDDSPMLLKDTIDGLTRVKNIVSNLKKFSYKGKVEFSLCNLNECINDCLELVKNELRYNIVVDLSLNEIPDINGQPSDLNQVFINLFINASHACGESGTLSIHSFVEENDVVITIKDNGKGISKENISKVFDPFFTTKEVGEGTGLGLSISHGIIEKHHGTIAINSKENEGTCFTIKLPIYKEF